MKCPAYMESREYMEMLAPQSTTQPFLIYASQCLFIENRLRGHACYNEAVASIGILPNRAV